MKSKIKRKLIFRLSMLIILFMMIGFTTFAYISNQIKIDSVFKSGNVKINVNDGKMIFDGTELIAPNDTLSKPLTITNIGTSDVYYRIYLQNVDCELGESISFNIFQNDILVYSSNPNLLTKENAYVGNFPLKINETITYKIEIEFKEHADNETQSKTISFDLVTEAVQTRNNENKEFN